MKVEKKDKKKWPAADGNRVGAHMGQLHIPKRRRRDGRHMAADSVELLFHIRRQQLNGSLVMVQDRQDRNGQTDKRATQKIVDRL